ncbi:MAG TPA: amino acid permease [Chloroflexi bacterium]|nr:amino acid permease [Chloroflexota bacterium]
MASRPFNLRRLIIGDPIETAMAKHERITKVKALAVFSSDALSSVAYATEEILFVLILAGTVGMQLLLPIALAIVFLLFIVGTSYYQTIHAYPSGGGAYIVSKENLGILPGLTAGGALMIGYILTVTVSIAAGVGAMYSAIPALLPYRVIIGIFAILLITMINMRGIKESATVFALPTYVFITTIVALLVFGIFKMATGTLLPVEVAKTEHLSAGPLQALTLFLILRAFSAGCTALTGVEAISNGIPAFKPPESDNAGKTLIGMIVILSTMFLGISVLANAIHAVPTHTETVLSQIGRSVFGPGLGYAITQGATALILILAANTAFADFPRLASLIAKDGYLPRQLASLGDRLVFSNGIIALGVLSAILLVMFGGDTHRLLPLYAAGVFLSFTLSQAGMVVRWWRLRGPGWQRSIAINGFGAFATGVVTAVVTITRFTQGAWIVTLLIPLVVWFFISIHRHYQKVANQLSLDAFGAPASIRRHRVIVPIGGVHRGVVHAIHYARSLSSDVTAIYVDVDPSQTEKIIEKWQRWGDGIRLEILPSPYRSVINPIHEYLDHLDRERQPHDMITVVLPQFVSNAWWGNLLHNQTALVLRLSLIFRRGTVVTDMPYRLKE